MDGDGIRELAELYLQYLEIGENFANQARYMGRRWWAKPFNHPEERENFGSLNQMFLYYKFNDTEAFYTFTRMTPPQFERLMELIGNSLDKHSRRASLSPELRVAVTLHYLGHGDHIETLAEMFHFGKSTLYSIIPETCSAIYNSLRGTFLSFPDEQDAWIAIANEFQLFHDMPNCIGALDTQQVEIVKPAHSGSFFWNYKEKCTLGNMALSDARKRFIWANVGAYGSLNDALVFSTSDLRNAFEQNLINLPPPRPLPNSQIVLPYYMIGDSGFHLETYLLTPYARARYLLPSRKMFNYRLSRARRIVECAFGLLASKWRVYQKPLGFNLSTTEHVILATMVLHNYLITMEIDILPQHRRYDNVAQIPERPVNPHVQVYQNNPNAENLRTVLRNYFCEEGQIAFQWARG